MLAISVPAIKPTKTAIDLINPLPQTCNAKIIATVIKPVKRFLGSPKLLAAEFPPPRFWIDTGIKESPITVIKLPVTTGGNSFLIFEK